MNLIDFLGLIIGIISAIWAGKLSASFGIFGVVAGATLGGISGLILGLYILYFLSDLDIFLSEWLHTTFWTTIWQDAVSDASKLPWAGNIVAGLNPTGELTAKVALSSKDRRLNRTWAFGRCDESSLTRFASSISPLTKGEPYKKELIDQMNELLIELVSNDKRDGFVFSEDDTVYYGVIKADGEQFMIECSYCKETGYFIIEISQPFSTFFSDDEEED